jgi:hypothetical protein
MANGKKMKTICYLPYAISQAGERREIPPSRPSGKWQIANGKWQKNENYLLFTIRY